MHPESRIVTPPILYVLDALMSPFTSNLKPGAVVPTPTCPVASIIILCELSFSNNIVFESVALTYVLRAIFITPPSDPQVFPGPKPSKVVNSVL